ncbi:hypothetical protein THAOC_22131, partial [Thalassiosira oceanica]
MALSTDVVEEARRSGSSTTGLGYLRIPPAHTPPLPSELQPQFATAKRGRREKKDEQGAHSYAPKWPGSDVAEPGLQKAKIT